MALSRAGGLLATGGKDGLVCIWDPASGRLIRRLPVLDNAVTALALSPDGKLLAVAEVGRDRDNPEPSELKPHVSLWELERGKLLRRLAGTEAPAMAVGFSIDGRTVYSLSWRVVKQKAVLLSW